MMAASSPFIVLWRAFLSQFLASESVSSEVQLRRTIIWVVSFLVTPVLYLTAIVLPTFEIVRLVAAARQTPEMIEQMLAGLSVLYVSYSMITTGLITAFVWDALNFERRDAMILGPLPVSGVTVIAAKLAALVTFLLGVSVLVNVSAGVPYALVTGGNDGLDQTLWHLAAYLAGTIGGAVFIFSLIITARGILLLLVGCRLAASVGTMLQFTFVSGVLCFFLVPAAIGNNRPIFVAATATDWLPTNWYFGLFEQIRGSTRPEIVELSRRALLALPVSVGGAIAVTILCFRRQLQSALASEQPSGFSPLFQVRRTISQWIAGTDDVARGVLEFVLMTLSRNGEQRAYIGIGGAVAVAVVGVALSRNFDGAASLMQPRTIVLWIPLVFGYWIAIGLRASFFLPSEIRAAWAFHVNTGGGNPSYWSGVRAAMIQVVLLPAVALNAIVISPLLGWTVAAWHTLVVSSVLIAMVELLSLTTDFVPYTQVYEPGHARLKTRWPLYLLGMFFVAYVPVRLELELLHRPLSILLFPAGAALVIVGAEITGRRFGATWKIEAVEPEDSDAATVLNIGAVSRSTIV